MPSGSIQELCQEEFVGVSLVRNGAVSGEASARSHEDIWMSLDATEKAFQEEDRVW